MRQIHLIMPYMRANNKEVLLNAYRPMDIILHPIMFEHEAAAISFDEPWIFPVIVPREYEQGPEGMEIQNIKRNYFIQNCEIIDDDYYVAVDDDDMYEPGVFDAVKQMDNDIVIISMKRGYRIPDGVIPDRRYPISTLYAHPDNVRVGTISNQQSFVKGHIFKKYLYDDQGHCGDGRLAVRRKEAGIQTVYRPDLFVLFNYYEPGRWEPVNVAFGCMINDAYRFNTVLKKSALPGEVHYTINPKSATKGINQLLDILEKEGVDIAVIAHQDIYFRNGWLETARAKLAELPDSWVVAGVVGKAMDGLICGNIHDMRIVDHIDSRHVHKFPQPAASFDECVLIFNMEKKFRFDESLDGFDLYGTLAVLQTWEMNGTTWIIDAFCEHYCMRPFTWFPGEDFKQRFKMLFDRYNAKFGPIDSTVFVSKEEVQTRFETSAAP
jgi:hypothetical protein